MFAGSVALHRFVFVSLFTVLPLGSYAQYTFLENGNPVSRGSETGYLLDTPTRYKLDLSGTWKYSVRGGPSGTVKVPSAYDFVGTVTFERTFAVTAEQLDKYDFSFVMLGTNYSCEIYLNGDFVTNHLGGYTSFVQSIPKNTLQVGSENVVKVVVSNQLDNKKTIPSRSTVWGWRNYGGILRDVFILAVPRLSLSGVELKLDLNEQLTTGKIHLKADVQGSWDTRMLEGQTGKKGAGLGFYAEMFDKISGISVGRSPLVPLARKGEAWEAPQCEMLVQNPKLWSPESPEIYLLKTFLLQTMGNGQSVVDEYDQPFGFRRVSVNAGALKLNGKEILLKGVLWNEDHATWGGSLPYEEMEKDVVLLKNLGANVVRFGNHPPHPYMLDLCDRYGLLAMEELPVVQVPASVLSEEYYQELAGTMMKEMVVRDRHHPSVLAWGIGDEFESSRPASRAFVESLVRTAKALDDRLTYFGCMDLANDVCTQLVDFAAISIHTQDLKKFKKQLQEWSDRHREAVVIVSKFGTEVQEGNRNGYSDPLSYEAQARFYTQRFDVVKSLELDGGILCAFNDWKGDRPSLTVTTGDPWMHTMGLVSSQREKRLAYDAVRSVFRGEKSVALPIGNHTTSAPIVYVLSGLVVLIAGAYFYNASRRFRENVNRSFMNSYNFFADVRDQRIVSVLLGTVLGLIVSVATAIVFSSVLYHFRESWVLDNLLSYMISADELKERVIYLIWSPIRSIPVLAVALFLSLLVVCGLILALSLLTRTRVYPYHAYAITMWATPPLLVLVPVGIVLYRVLENDVYVLPALLFVAALLFWVFLRWLKGISIIFDVYPLKVYVVGLLSLAALFLLIFLYLDYTQSASMYWAFLNHFMGSSQ